MDYNAIEVLAYIRENCAEEAELVLEQAEELMAQTFRFVQPWDMEPCEIPYRLSPMVWDRTPNGDPEWVYMLNRHDFLHKLLQAYLLTGERRYSNQAVKYILDWIRNNPVRPEGGGTIRTIDTGIRCMNWISVIVRLGKWKLIEKTEAEEILQAVSRQFSYMKNAYIGKYSLSNWGVLQTAAICCGYLWFREYLPEDGLEEWAWNELQMQLQLQVMGDGSHWEQSVMYHVEVLNSCMKLFVNCRYTGYTAPEWLEETILRMSRYVLHAAGPDYCQIAQADSDVTDVRDVLTKAAVLCGDRELRFRGFPKMDLDSAWLLGTWGIGEYEKMKGREPEARSLNCPDTGNIYIRSGWERDANYTYLHCGPLGSAHGHGDLTQMCLYYQGKPFLVDSGRYSYREEEPLRAELKNAGAHNVRLVDGYSPARPVGSWSYEAYGEPLKNYYSGNGPVHYAEMAYHYETQYKELCLVTRKVMFHERGIWLIVDDICCRGKHSVEEAWHLDSGVMVETACKEPGGLNRISMTAEKSTLNLWSEGSYTVEACRISKRYNKLEDSRKLVGRGGFTDRLTDWRCFAGEGIAVSRVPVYRSGQKEAEPETRVTALECGLGGGENWTFLLWNRETYRGNKLYVCNGQPVYGRAAALCFQDGEYRETLRL